MRFPWARRKEVKAEVEKVEEVKAEEDGRLGCPTCGSVEWYEGPGCGGAQNVQCARCGDWYNNTPFGLEFLRHSALPYIVNSKTKERVECASGEQAIEEAYNRNWELLKYSKAASLSEQEHWLAYDGTVLLTDIVALWRSCWPDRRLV